MGALGSRHLQPVARLCELSLTRLTVITRQLQLRTQITCPGSLAQQLQTDATVTGVAAIAAQQLPQTTLCHDNPLTGRLLEHASGDAFDTGVMSQAWAIEQPQGQAGGQASAGVGRVLGGVESARLHVGFG